MTERTHTVLELIKNIDKRASQDFEDAYQEFMNACDDDEKFNSKMAMYLQGIVINAIKEMFYFVDSTDISLFLQIIMDNEFYSFLLKQRNSGEQHEE